MTQYDPDLDPNRVPPAQPVYTETVETVVVRPESNTGWWVAGILAATVLIAVFWILATGREDTDDQAQLALAQAEVAQAQADAERAAVQGQIAGAQQSLDFARADAARAQAEAARAVSEARAAQAAAEAEASRATAQRAEAAEPGPAVPSAPSIISTTPQP